MPEDIRDKATITHDDVLGLNFIKQAVPYYFRRHYRQGLRSHIMEIVDPADMELEQKGTIIEGIRWFPKAIPLKMLRIFRSRFKALTHVQEETKRVKLVESYLAPAYLARSSEIVVDYKSPDGRDILLCGLQEYVEGEIIDPWSILGNDSLLGEVYDSRIKDDESLVTSRDQWIRRARNQAANFIEKIKQMIMEAHHIPDLAGVGNLLIQRSGLIKLVDINNISPVAFDAEIRLDDKGYPVCDKSIEALALLEQKIVGGTTDKKEPVYRTFLDPQRRRDVKALEEIFHRRKLNGQEAS